MACVRRERWWVFTNWAVLIGYIILFNLLVTFLLAFLNRACPATCDALQLCQLLTQLSVSLSDVAFTAQLSAGQAVSSADVR